MSDRMAAQISIGGPFPRRLVPELLNEIQTDGAGFAWENRVPQSEDDLVAEADGDVLTLTDDEARFGEFEYLEAFLLQHNVPWDRSSDAKYEHDGLLSCFRPGRQIIHFKATQSGVPLVPLEDALYIKERLQQVQNGNWSGLRLALDRLDKIAPEVEPLKPFEIVDDKPVIVKKET